MLRNQLENFGLGVILLGDDGQRTLLGTTGCHIFCHGGCDQGFDTYFIATADTGRGAVVMINKNDDQSGID